MAIEFPNTHIDGTTYTFNSITWVWNGVAWDRQSTGGGGGATGATGPQGVTGPVGDYVISFNGVTGAVTGASLGANIFTALNTFDAGLSASGATFSGNITTPNLKITSNTITTSTGLTVTIPNATSTLVNLSNTQTLTNKTLTTPSITNPTLSSFFTTSAGGNIVTIPDATSTLVNLSSIQTLTSKTLTSPKILQIYTGEEFGNIISLPDATGTIALTKSTVASFNGLTGAVTGASLGANIFTALNSFSAGLSAAGGVTFSGTFSGATASFSKLLTASAGLSASALTVSGRISSTEGITFGSGTTFMAFIPDTSANNGGLWVRDGMIQVGGTSIGTGQGNWSVNPFTEIMYFSGRQEMYVNNAYQAAQNAISIAIGVSHSADAIRITKQTGTLSDAYKIAGCNSNGVWYGAGVSASGATFSGNISAPNIVNSFNGLTGAVTGITAGGANTFTALNTFSAGLSAAGGVTFSGNFSGATGAFSKLLSASAGLSAGGNIVFNAVTAVFGASAANTTPITLYKDNATDNPPVDNFGMTTFDTPSNKVPLTLSFTEVYDPYNTEVTAAPGSIMIRVRDQTAGLDTFTVTDTGGVSCTTAIFANDITVRGVMIGLGGGGFTENLAFGDGALTSNETGIYNTAVGAGALSSLTVGQDNSAFGAGALGSLQDGNTNVAIGRAALQDCIDGSGNIAIGKQTLYIGAHAEGNIAIGTLALSTIQYGQYNVAIGDNCLISGECNYNVANGKSALQHITTGDNNVALGYQAGKRRGSGSSTLTSATESIFIGNTARGSTSGMTREIVIGSNALGLGSETTVIGVTSTLGNRIFGVASTGLTASTIASAATIAPTKTITFISGTTAIVTITAPSLIATTGGQITLIPTGIFTTTTAGNIALASTAVVSKALIMTYDAGTAKWYPSY